MAARITFMFLSCIRIASAYPAADEGLDRLCDAIFSPRRKLTVTPSPIEVNVCLERKKNHMRSCLFDPKTCEWPCRFGHALDENNCPISCKCALEGVFEGDIRFGQKDLPLLVELYEEPAQDRPHAAASNMPRWDENRILGRVMIPYMIKPGMSTEAEAAIEAAIDGYSKETCIDFIPRTNEDDHLVFTRQNGCWSYVGRRGGAQQVSIGEGCEWVGIVQHELLHALGFWHEQSRPDRDNHVTIEYKNIISDMTHNFQKRTDIESFGSEYDTKSLTHYGGYDFTQNSQPTIVDKATGQPVRSQRDGLSESDKFQLNKMYKCGEGTEIGDPAHWGSWDEWSQCSNTCGVGEKRRTRICLQGEREVSYKECKGLPIQQQYCKISDCVSISDPWATWKQWSTCSLLCGGGYQWRTRKCNSNDEEACDGSKWDTRICNSVDC